MNYETLKAYQREHRDNFHPNLALRSHRALSWLQRAEMEQDDQDAQFIFLWIAFNASYAVEIEHLPKERERDQFSTFFEKICELDQEQKIYHQLWTVFSSQIRALLNNKFVHQPFWDFQNGRIDEAEWSTRFKSAKQTAAIALANQDTVTVLSIIFSRLYTLRNQLVHGGATWNSGANRQQIKECSAMLQTIVPLIIDTMMQNPNTLWGDAYYPVIKE